MVQFTTARSARDHALAVLRVRNGLIALALLPAAVLAVWCAAGAAGHLPGGWSPLRWGLAGFAAGVLALAVAVGLTVARSRPPVIPTLPVAERDAPALYVLIRELAERLDVPPPGSIALTPDCDSWLEDLAEPVPGAADAGPVLVIGTPFLWWMRVAELRALLAPVVAGTGPHRHPDIAAARRCVRGLDGAAAAAAARPPGTWRPWTVLTGWFARLLLRWAAPHAAGMERGVAEAAAVRARHTDPGLRTVAQEQVGLAYAGWDRLLTRVALPAWRAGRWPGRLNAGVVASLTELSQRDRLADGFTGRLSERPASTLLDEPEAVDEAVSRLAAELLYGPGPLPATTAGVGGDAREPSTVSRSGGAVWTGPPLSWDAYPQQVVAPLWRERAARLFAVLHTLGGGALPAATAGVRPPRSGPGGATGRRVQREQAGGEAAGSGGGPALSALLHWLATPGGERAQAVATRLAAEVARADGAAADRPAPPGADAPGVLGLPPSPVLDGATLLAQHIEAAVCWAAAGTSGGAPGLDWLDGPVLILGGARAPDLGEPVRALAEDGDAGPLRVWLTAAGVEPDDPLRLV